MSLAELTQSRFVQNSIDRGASYFEDSKVSLRNHFNAKHAQFFVFGSRKYEVHIELSSKTEKIQFSCTCPHFKEGVLCKHIWAAVLYADANALFPQTVQMREEQPKTGHTWHDEYKRSELRLNQKKPNRSSSVAYDGEKLAHYIVDLQRTIDEGKVCIRFCCQDIRKNGELGPLRQAEIFRLSIDSFAEEVDQTILSELIGRNELISNDIYSSARNLGLLGAKVPPRSSKELLSRISATGRFGIQKIALKQPYSGRDLATVEKYSLAAEPWELVYTLRESEDGYSVVASMTDGSRSRRPREVIGRCGVFIFFGDFMATSTIDSHPVWFDLIEKNQEIPVAPDELNSFLDFFFSSKKHPKIILPENIRFEEATEIQPKVRVSLSSSSRKGSLEAELEFIYEERVLPAQDTAEFIIDAKSRRRIYRQKKLEAEATAKFLEMSGLAIGSEVPKLSQISLSDVSLPQFAQKAFDLGWEVHAQKMAVRPPQDFNIRVSSGVDWFELNAEVKFDGFTTNLPYLLNSLKAGQRFVKLGDGSFGMLPEEWLKKLGPLSEMGIVSENGLKLNRVQALFLSASLDGNEKFSFDQKFQSLKNIVDDFNKPPRIALSKDFHGKLRHYQEEGLSWLSVVSKHEIGAILADDMGLGKTIQILALLSQHYKNAGDKGGSTLIVAPKSLIFNWMAEVEKFTPDLKVLNLTGSKRHLSFNSIKDFQIVLTTYQSLRIDIEKLQGVEFEFFILDEAHFVKNPDAQSSLACRMVRAKRKISLSGTPVENSLADLFSILAVVNPGLISDEQANRWLASSNTEDLRVLSKALRPFILRRKKEQVLKDLPEKTEQVLYCELSTDERRRYNELKNFYWNHLSGKIQEKGVSRSKIEILEALLRLRQASCHQGLLDESAKSGSSSKFELLIEQVEMVIEDGHKALIFSQFTSLLKLLATELDSRKIVYEYLDGKTKDRAERVERFQTDTEVKLFLLSLKAGGVGLNLTAADYVFVLDPWWNPAAESQAIDRAHRIGQTNKVFAYKIIAKDTVEEKILELQKTKRDLAEAIVSQDGSLIKNLKLEDLQSLFN